MGLDVYVHVDADVHVDVDVIYHNDVIMSAMASKVTYVSIVCSTVFSGTDQLKNINITVTS